MRALAGSAVQVGSEPSWVVVEQAGQVIPIAAASLPAPISGPMSQVPEVDKVDPVPAEPEEGPSAAKVDEFVAPTEFEKGPVVAVPVNQIAASEDIAIAEPTLPDVVAESKLAAHRGGHQRPRPLRPGDQDRAFNQDFQSKTETSTETSSPAVPETAPETETKTETPIAAVPEAAVGSPKPAALWSRWLRG